MNIILNEYGYGCHYSYDYQHYYSYRNINFR